MALDAARQTRKRDFGRRDGPRENDPDDRVAGDARDLARDLGAALGRGANQSPAQLGDRVQTMVPWLQDPYLLRDTKREEGETTGLEQAQHIQYLHHFLQNRGKRQEKGSDGRSGII